MHTFYPLFTWGVLGNFWDNTWGIFIWEILRIIWGRSVDSLVIVLGLLCYKICSSKVTNHVPLDHLKTNVG